MRKKLFKILNTVYGVLMTASFFAGILPLFGFIVALIVGGDFAETLSVFFYKEYYPWVIIAGSIALVVGLIAMYVGKLEALSVKKMGVDTDTASEDK